MTTLREQIQADVGDVLLNTDDFAESCTYLPKSGDARSIVAVVEEGGIEADEMSGVQLVSTVTVFVSRDETTGIDAPQLGEQLCRESDHLADGSPDPLKLYSYSGIVDESDDAMAASWTLVFTRKRPFEKGGNRLR